jgi:hypothetical protein
MRKSRRVGLGAVVGAVGMLAVGAPLLAQGDHDGMNHDARMEAAAERQADKAAREERKAAREAARAAQTSFFANLKGKNEINPTTGKRRAGDMDGTGGATVVIQGDQLCFAITVKGIGTPNAMHIHKARAGKNGDVVVPLTQPTAGDPGASAGCVTVAADLATQIYKRSRGFYVNVHTDDFPAGALRGQLHKLPRGS